MDLPSILQLKEEYKLNFDQISRPIERGKGDCIIKIKEKGENYKNKNL
jgi:hypothetical protein